MEESSGTTLTDAFWAAVTPLWCASVPGMAGDLAGAFQLVTLVTGEADYRADRKASLGPHGASSVHHLPRIRALLYCGPVLDIFVVTSLLLLYHIITIVWCLTFKSCNGQYVYYNEIELHYWRTFKAIQIFISTECPMTCDIHYFRPTHCSGICITR